MMRPLKRNEGFSLFEMIIVVAIMGLIAVLALPSIGSYFQLSLDSATRDLASIVKETYNATAVTGNVHQIVYDLKEGQYWVESGPPDALMDTKASLEKEERRKKWATVFEKEKEEKKISPFTLDKTVTRKKVALPRGVTFEDVVTQIGPDPITEGTAYTHFFPHGITEQTIVHLKDESKHKASLVISPIIGRTDLYDRYVSAHEAFGDASGDDSGK